MDGSTVAVTGAGGFIGSHVVERLRERRSALSLLYGSADAAGAALDVARILRGSVTDRALVSELVRGVRVVVHLAGPASVRLSFGDPLGFVQAHVAGTTALLEASLRAKVGRFVYVSSAEIYGVAPGAALTEDEPPRPVSPYGAAKLGAEALVRVFAEQGLQSIVLRPFSVYGTGQSRHGVVHSIVSQALDGSRIALESLSQVRDFVHVTDVARAVQSACVVESQTKCRVFNVGTGRATTIGELARIVMRAAERELPIVEVRNEPARSTDINRLVADTARARDELGWTAATELAVGVKTMLREQARS